MRIYLASRFDRKDELLKYREILESLGHNVVSRWLESEFNSGLNREKYALIDKEDVISCDLIICFTEDKGVGFTSGGRHVEFGIAVALNKHIIVVGYRENLFYHLPEVKFFDSIKEVNVEYNKVRVKCPNCGMVESSPDVYEGQFGVSGLCDNCGDRIYYLIKHSKQIVRLT